MKKTLAKGVAFILVLSILFLFAACSGTGKTESTGDESEYSTVYTDNSEATSAGEIAYIKVTDGLLQAIIDSGGKSVWDGNQNNLTEEQKKLIEDYFINLGGGVAFREDGVYQIVTGETVNPVKVISYSKVSDDTVRAVIESDGATKWNGSQKNLAAAQKRILSDYYEYLGKRVEFREDGVYEVIVKNQETVTKINTAATKPGQATKPMATDSQQSTAAPAFLPTFVSLNETSMTIQIGTSFMLTAVVLPVTAVNKTVTWESLNPSVAAVSSAGLVTAKSPGEATVACTANAAGSVRSICEITVVGADAEGVVSYKYSAAGEYFYLEDGAQQRGLALGSLNGTDGFIAAVKCSPVKVEFDYAGLGWMIRLCKGQYGSSFIGSEIGLYTKSAGGYESVSDENMLKTEMLLYRGNKLLFTRGYGAHRWSTGFVQGSLTGSDSTELVLTARITLKDDAMAQAFEKALKAQGFTKGINSGISTPDIFRVSGKNVYLTWKYIGLPGLSGKIIFNSNGGSATGYIRGVAGESVSAPADPERAGYVFGGWNPELPDTYPKRDLTVTAVWIKAD